MSAPLKHDPATLPERMRSLPIDDRGFVVPWFVAWIDGKPEFRGMDAGKWSAAVREKLCWVCGQKLGKYLCFAIGPMCGVNRTTSEPPCHLECARWSAKNCPFLSRPKMTRREDEALLEHSKGKIGTGGFGIKRNPGVALLWVTKSYEVYRDGMGGWLIEIGDPVEVEWYSEGRPATRAEVEESIRTGLPFLEELARQEPGGLEALEEMKAGVVPLYPAA